mgnify:CR=1 FL=1
MVIFLKVQINGRKSYKSEINGQTDRQACLPYIHVNVQSKVGQKTHLYARYMTG